MVGVWARRLGEGFGVKGEGGMWPRGLQCSGTPESQLLQGYLRGTDTTDWISKTFPLPPSAAVAPNTLSGS